MAPPMSSITVEIEDLSLCLGDDLSCREPIWCERCFRCEVCCDCDSEENDEA